MPTPAKLIPTEAFWGWRGFGACLDVDEHLFYNDEDERKGVRRRKEQVAKEVCYRCPVLRQCREYSLDAGEDYGVWGGLDENERRRILRERRNRTDVAR